jgi:hypothetical protein
LSAAFMLLRVVPIFACSVNPFSPTTFSENSFGMRAAIGSLMTSSRARFLSVGMS